MMSLGSQFKTVHVLTALAPFPAAYLGFFASARMHSPSNKTGYIFVQERSTDLVLSQLLRASILVAHAANSKNC